MSQVQENEGLYPVIEEALAEVLGIVLTKGEEITLETVAEFTDGRGEDDE